MAVQKTITLKGLTIEETNTILKGLGTLPLAEAVQVWTKVGQQAEACLAPKPPKEPK